jgi:hypothetical protein
MNISYSFVADWGFYRTAFARYRQQRPHRHRAIVMAIAIATVLLLAWLYGLSSGALWTPIPLFALIGGVAGALGTFVLVKILVPQRMKRAPNYGATVSVTLDDEGLHAVEPHAQATLAWPAFTRVVRFGDGILLIRGRVIRWLPDAALQNSTPDDALAFVRSKTQVDHAG